MLARLHRRRRLHARVRLLAHRRARLAGQPAGGDALAAHRLGAVVHAGAVAALDARVGARAGGAVPVPDGRSRCSPPATTSCSTSSAALLAIAAAFAIVELAGRALARPRDRRGRRPAYGALRRPPAARSACHKVVTKSKTGRLAPPPQTVEGHFDGSAASKRADFLVCRVALRHMPDFDANEDLSSPARRRLGRISRTRRRGHARRPPPRIGRAPAGPPERARRTLADRAAPPPPA